LNKIGYAVVAAMISSGSAAYAQSQASDPQKQPITVSKVTSNIVDGTPWLTVTSGIFNATIGKYGWNDGAGQLNVRAFEKPIRDELKREGYRIAKDPDSPFPDDTSSNLLLGARITGLNAHFHVILHSAEGDATMSVEWQVYSSEERKVIATFQTNGEGHVSQNATGDYKSTLIEAMDENVRALTGSDGFKTLLASQDASTTTDGPVLKAPTGHLASLPLMGSVGAKSVRISDAVGAVVLVLSGDGHGSGVLISSDGYVLTDAHVVGSDKYVKIRWSDGLEGLGEVVRSDKRRDVALIKTDPRGRSPLPLRTQAPDPGATVFAIGAPEDPKLQSTVTRGVVSASNRIVDGFSFIQSDVTVNPGNSGGPLLDEKGEVLGLTDWKLQTGDGATGLNFFTPIGDALAFLSLQPQ
jgi:S1-C subfamily serine protease